jgi:transposase-like protein
MLQEKLPKHLNSIYKEMRGIAEERIFNFDLKKWLKNAYQHSIEIEFENFIGLNLYERNDCRKDYRNGFYRRTLDTVYGFIDDIKIPRARSSTFRPSVIGRYKRREQALNRLITECYWRGVSTRDVKKILEALAGIEVSASTVSRVTDEWKKEVFRWHQRPIQDDYIYLFLDGVWIKNRSLGGKKRLVLMAFGIKENGEKEVIDYMLSTSEKAENWIKFLTFLNHRGLEGKKLKLIIADGHKGIWNAVDVVFPGIPNQLCWAHKMRNILNKVKRKDHDEVHKGLKEIFSEETTTRSKAEKIVNRWKREWKSIYPQAVKSLERNEEILFNYFDCPKSHYKSIRTSNHIERVFKEFRRRMRGQEITPNHQAADKILYALVQIRNEKLKEYPLKITQN